MTSLMVVGADHLGNIQDKLKTKGFENVLHIDGRKVQVVKRAIPDHVDIILVLTDYINHNLAKVIKQRAKESNKPVYFCKRSWSSIQQIIGEFKLSKKI
ncbi:DUF2325 domain-containing protein [Sutcliffiella rhizosphaerae]|uniref:Dihydroorotate dehydrogenase n=1 Tax=Sutcliffiella rhizosphaerae TaxID=2880967 RepID=A0ABM8YQY5_9BACI|nr:DUF2325 domain-containing protein [Sutcliffiella rhizosphaerae]CAG9622411.1 hypothetical protein BACCIP111883_03202 [Sutcliffiella rhizosphaerae]